MNISIARALAVIAACVLSNLASSQNFQPVTDASTPIQRFGFGVLPPSADQWLIAIDASSEAIAFGKKDPEHAKKRGSVLVIAARLRARTHVIDTAEGLKAEVTEQVRANSARFTLVSLEVEPYRDEAKSTDCVRIATTSEERRNPNRPDEVLLMTISGKACRQPDSTTHYVQVTVSERRPAESATLFDDKLRAECDRVVNSVQFTPLR